MRPKPKKKPLWIRLLGGLAYVTLCAVALGVGSFFGWAGKSPLAMKMITSVMDPPEVGDKEVFEGEDSTTLLILGCDQDLYYKGQQVLLENARSDMMLVAKLDFKNNRISGISIPRDTLVAAPGYREQKINAYHAIGARRSPEEGKELAKQAVETLMPVKIDRVLVLNYNKFADMVDLVGGVDVFVPKDMFYEDKAANLFIDLKAGRHHLDGYKAMGFVRYRKSNKGHRGGDNDFQRQDRQKEFLMAFKDSVMKNKAQLPAIAETAKQAIGGGLTDEEIIALSYFARQVGKDNIKMGMLPVVDAYGYNLRVNERELQKTLEEFNMVEARYTRN